MSGPLLGERAPLPFSVGLLVAGSALMGFGIHGAIAPTSTEAEAPRASLAVETPSVAPPAQPEPAAQPELTTQTELTAVVAPALAPPTPPPARPRAPEAPAADCPSPLVYRFVVGSERALVAPDDAAIDALRDRLARHPEARLLVVGHSDGTGDENANLILSHRRAQRVNQLLLERGIEPRRTTVRGLGEFAPVEGAAASDAVNRRVVVHVRGIEGCEDARAW